MTHFYGYTIKNGRILIVDEDGNECDFCEEIRVVKIITDVATGKQFVGIRITRADGTRKYEEFPRSMVVDDPISALTDIGLSVAPVRAYEETISEILFDTENTAFREYRHDCLGFRNTKTGRAFLGREVIGANIRSTYSEPKKLKPRGSFEAWKTGIAAHVKNRPELQLALAIGASAPVAATLKRLGILDGAAVCALIGESSSGKTTSMKMMASIWGRPTIADGVIDTFVSTEAYFFAELGKKNGFPHFVDETSAQPHMDLTTLAYNISLGRERGRCKPDGTPRPRKKWAGTVVLTGENSLFQQTNQNRGLYARVLEFAFKWTADPESAEALERFVLKHYGVAAEPLIKEVLSTSDTEMEELFDGILQGVTNELQPENGVERRIMKLYTIILMSALIAQEAWAIPLDFHAILDLLKAHHVGNTEVKDRVREVYESIKQQVLANWAKFPQNAAECDASSIWGEQGKHKQWACVWITAKHFREFLENAGEFNLKTALAPLHAKGWLAKFGDRYKKQHKLGAVSADCYCLLLQPSQGIAPIPKSKIINTKNIKNLLENGPEDIT